MTFLSAQNPALVLFLQVYHSNWLIECSIWVFCIFVLLGFVWIHLYFSFWKFKNIYHVYNAPWYRWFREPFIIQQKQPKLDVASRSRFAAFNRLETYKLNDDADSFLQSDKAACALYVLQSLTLTENAADNDDYCFLFMKPQLKLLSIGHNAPAYVSILFNQSQQNDNQQNNNNTDNEQQKRKAVGVIVARPVKIIMPTMTINAYMWDPMCASQQQQQKQHPHPHPHQNIRSLIETHEWNQRFLNPDYKVSIFRKENNLSTGLVPFVQFNSYIYPSNSRNNNNDGGGGYYIATFGPNNLALLLHSRDPRLQLSLYFRLLVMVHLQHWVELVCNNAMIVVGLYARDGGHLGGLYFFRETYCTRGDADKPLTSLMCIGSVCFDDTPPEEFVFGFLQCIQNELPPHDSLFVENIAHNFYFLTTQIAAAEEAAAETAETNAIINLLLFL